MPEKINSVFEPTAVSVPIIILFHKFSQQPGLFLFFRTATRVSNRRQALTQCFCFSTTFDTLKRDYFSGIQTNLKLMEELYGPDWIMRLYYQIPKESQNWKRLCSIVCQNSNIDICDAENNPMFGKP